MRKLGGVVEVTCLRIMVVAQISPRCHLILTLIPIMAAIGIEAYAPCVGWFNLKSRGMSVMEFLKASAKS